MDELWRMSITLHLVFVVVTMGIALLHVGMLYTIKDFQALAKKIHALIPAYYLLLSALFFTGLIAWAVMRFGFSHGVMTMLLVWVLILAGSIRAYSLFKRTKFSSQEEVQGKFVAFAKKKYLFDIAVLVLMLIIT